MEFSGDEGSSWHLSISDACPNIVGMTSDLAAHQVRISNQAVDPKLVKISIPSREMAVKGPQTESDTETLSYSWELNSGQIGLKEGS